MMNFGHDRFGGSAKIHVCAAEQQKKLHRVKRKAETPHLTSRGCSSAGRAPALQAGGQEFDSPPVSYTHLDVYKRQVIHMDPVETNNERVVELHHMVEKIIEEIDPQLSFHDFRIVDGPSHTNLIFDLLMPYGLYEKRIGLEEEIERRIRETDDRCYAVMTVDTSFTGEV